MVLSYIILLKQSRQNEKEIEIFDIIASHIFNIGTLFVKKLSNPELQLSSKRAISGRLDQTRKKHKRNCAVTFPENFFCGGYIVIK